MNFGEGDICEVLSGPALGLQLRIVSIKKSAYHDGRQIASGVVIKTVQSFTAVGGHVSFYDNNLKVVKRREKPIIVKRKIFAEKGWGP